MKVDISYVSTKHYDMSNISQWMWMFKRYVHVRGFIVRIFGIHINVVEKNASKKLIAKAHKQMNA